MQKIIFVLSIPHGIVSGHSVIDGIMDGNALGDTVGSTEGDVVGMLSQFPHRPL
jgi:hypothetical protein